MGTYIYQIEAVSNLHVGSGESNEGYIDKLIQRDSVTRLPQINSSGLKGALREHCTGVRADNELVEYVFGSDPNDKNKRKAGAYRFFDARLLAIPVRADKAPYFMATCPMVLREYFATLELFGIPLTDTDKECARWTASEPLVTKKNKGAHFEDLEKVGTNLLNLQPLSALTGEPYVLLPDVDFKTLCDDDHLPVMARNHLNNGKSDNLWYEQVLPRFTRLYFVLLTPDDDNKMVAFDELLIGGLVQIGANATVGYGYCRLTKKIYTK